MYIYIYIDIDVDVDVDVDIYIYIYIYIYMCASPPPPPPLHPQRSARFGFIRKEQLNNPKEPFHSTALPESPGYPAGTHTTSSIVYMQYAQTRIYVSMHMIHGCWSQSINFQGEECTNTENQDYTRETKKDNGIVVS